MNDVIEKLIMLFSTDQISDENYEDLITMFCDEYGNIDDDKIKEVQFHLSKINNKSLEILDLINLFNKEKENFVLSQESEIIDDNKDIKIYKPNTLGIPIEKLYEVLYATKAIED